jgi:hypothetical protein
MPDKNTDSSGKPPSGNPPSYMPQIEPRRERMQLVIPLSNQRMVMPRLQQERQIPPSRYAELTWEERQQDRARERELYEQRTRQNTRFMGEFTHGNNEYGQFAVQQPDGQTRVALGIRPIGMGAQLRNQ